MKTPFLKRNRSRIVFMGLFAFFIQHTISAQNLRPMAVEIISQVITYGPLWERLPSEARNISAYYIMDHGVELDMTPGLNIHGKPVNIIHKGDIDSLNGSPYFLFHTLNIESSTALVRLYLIRNTVNGEITEFAEFTFHNQNNSWILITTSL